MFRANVIVLILVRTSIPLIIIYMCNLILNRKVSFLKLSVITVSASFISSFAITYILHEGVLAGLLLLLVPFALICLFFADPFSKKLIAFGGMLIVTFASEMLSFGLMGGVSNLNDYRILYAPALRYTIHQLIMLLFMLALGLIFIKTISFISNSKNNKYILLLGIYVFIQIFNTSLYAYFWYALDLPVFIGVIYMSLPVLWLLFTFYLIKNIKRYERKNLETEFVKEQLYIQKKYFIQLKTNYEQTMKLRHDFANFRDTINGLFNLGQAVKGHELLEELSNLIDNSTQIISSGNEAVDALIFYKLQTIKERKIDCDIRIKIPKNKFSDLDLCSLISNLLDNAIDANENIEETRYISLVSSIKLGYLSFILSNSFNHILNSELKTTKTDKANHGIGLKIIDSIIEKYDGYSSVSTENNKFQQVVYLKLSTND